MIHDKNVHPLVIHMKLNLINFHEMLKYHNRILSHEKIYFNISFKFNVSELIERFEFILVGFHILYSFVSPCLSFQSIKFMIEMLCIR